MSDCSASPIFLEVSVPAVKVGSELLNELFDAINRKVMDSETIIRRNVWIGCCGISFDIEDIDGKEYVVAHAVVKRGGVDAIINVVRDVLTQVSVDLNQLVVRTFDPCNHKTLDRWLDVCWGAFNEFRECREERCSGTKGLSEWARCYNECEEEVIKELMGKYGMSRDTAEFCVNIGYCD